MDTFFFSKRVLVTGAGRGIGKAIVKELSAQGAQVIAVSKTLENLEQLSKEIPSIQKVHLDISDWASTKEIVQALMPIDLLVNNAGLASLQPFGDVSEDEFDRVFAVNVKAALNVSQIVANDMKLRKAGGSIVNISSQASKAAIQDHTVYCMSKAALDHMTKVMALELGPHQIRVNSVNPTVVLTEMAKMAWSDASKADPMRAKIPLGKFCDPEEVVDCVMFLLSDKAKMITGACIPIDGGYTIH